MIWADIVEAFSGHRVCPSEFLLLQMENCLKLKQLSDPVKYFSPTKIHRMKTFFIKIEKHPAKVLKHIHNIKTRKFTFYRCVDIQQLGWGQGRYWILDLFLYLLKMWFAIFYSKDSLKAVTFI